MYPISCMKEKRRPMKLLRLLWFLTKLALQPKTIKTGAAVVTFGAACAAIAIDDIRDPEKSSTVELVYDSAVIVSFAGGFLAATYYGLCGLFGRRMSPTARVFNGAVGIVGAAILAILGMLM